MVQHIRLFPIFSWFALPAILIGIISFTVHIDWIMNFDATNTRHVINTSFSVIIAIACLTGLITLRMYSEMQRAKTLARTDELTGLINRREFNRILTKELTQNSQNNNNLALIALDLDRFKAINDTYGHEAGDAVICQFGQRIQSILRGNDVVCRISGDEFFVLLRDIKTAPEIKFIGNRILDAMKVPFIHNDLHIEASASLGSAFIEPNTEHAASAMRMADFALFRSKEQGRNRLVQFDPEMAKSIRNRQELELKFRDAITHKTLSTRYHPIVSQEAGDIVGVEALVRWVSKEDGEIPPSKFLPLAAELNLIEEIGSFVLERACEEIGPIPGFRLAVNISQGQFLRENFLQMVDETLLKTGFPANRLELEVPQTLLALNSNEVAIKLEKLRERGIRIALDDFGTGYSNMMFLRKFKLDRIKLDRSFMHKMTSEADGSKMVTNMIELGNSLSSNVTVEGIETSEQLDRLRDSKCNEFQGFFFSKPLSVPELLAKAAADRLSRTAGLLNSANNDDTDTKLSA